MKREKATILLISKNQKAVKPKQVSVNFILHWKKYVAGFLMVIGLLGWAIFSLLSEKMEQDNVQAQLRNKIHQLHSSFAQIDTSAIKVKFTNIDKELEGINKFLKARGIPTAIQVPQGGEESDDFLSAEETGDFYANYLKKISYNLSYTPLGYPFRGAITSTFGHRENPFTGANVETHKGLDIRAPMGAPVKAMAKGTVVFAGRKGGFGNCIVLKHANGFETLYGHLSKILVSGGQSIDIGQQIGNVGSTGRSTGPHLHYEVHRFGQKINPQSFLTLN